jgi:DNA-binding NarL/FixJ family response regulator
VTAVEPERRRALVLIVSDSQPTRVGVRRLLEGDVDCAEAVDGPSAVEQALRHRPDVCMLDLRPPAQGLRVASELAAKLPSSAVILFTPAPDEAEFVAAVRAGASGYLPLAFDPARLPQVVQAVIGGEVAVPRRYVRWLVDEVRDGSRRHRLAVRDGSSVSLTEREWQIVGLLRRRLTTQEIAESLELSPVTVRRHVSAVERKLGVSSRAALFDLLG